MQKEMHQVCTRYEAHNVSSAVAATKQALDLGGVFFFLSHEGCRLDGWYDLREQFWLFPGIALVSGGSLFHSTDDGIVGIKGEAGGRLIGYDEPLVFVFELPAAAASNPPISQMARPMLPEEKKAKGENRQRSWGKQN